MRKISLIFILILGLSGCNESSDADDTSSISTGGSTSTSLVCEDASFSDYLEFCSSRSVLRISYSFFPDGTDFNFTDQTATIPCISASASSDISIQISEPEDGSSCADTVLSFTATDESFTLEGIVVPMSSEYTKFESDYQLVITSAGFTHSTDDSLVSASGGKLEDFITAISN